MMRFQGLEFVDIAFARTGWTRKQVRGVRSSHGGWLGRVYPPPSDRTVPYSTGMRLGTGFRRCHRCSHPTQRSCETSEGSSWWFSGTSRTSELWQRGQRHFGGMYVMASSLRYKKPDGEDCSRMNSYGRAGKEAE